MLKEFCKESFLLSLQNVEFRGKFLSLSMSVGKIKAQNKETQSQAIKTAFLVEIF